MPERRKRVLQNTKIRAAAFTCCLLFPKKRARTFPGGLAQTPSVISRCLRATRLSATVIYFFLLLFHFLCPVYFSFFADNLHTQPATHPVWFCLLSERYAFIIFRSKHSHFFASRYAFFRRQPAVILPAAFLSIRRSVPRIPALPATRFPYLFLSKHS